jgi:HNH endonuclease
MVARPAIPSDLERAVLIECGHRCAIPTCRQTPVELAHIIPWSKCKEHKFENLIGLCPTCHTRYDSHEIDRKAMQIYKLNLLLLNSRYGDLEQRVIQGFVENRSNSDFWWFSEMEILLARLIEDGLLRRTGRTRTTGGLVQNEYTLTNEGSAFVGQWPAK